MGRRTITRHLKYAKSSAERHKFAHEWAYEWERRYVELLTELKYHLNRGSIDGCISILGELRGLQAPKFNALHNVIDELIYPSREIIDDDKE